MLSADDYSGLQGDLVSLPADLMAYRLDKMARRHPDDARVWFLLGATRHKLGQLPQALEAFERTVELAPSNVQAANAKGGLLAALGRQDEALLFLERTREKFPDDPSVPANLGYLHEQAPGGHEKALACYDAALRLDASHHAARMNRGYLLTLLKRLPEAVENNRRFAELNPGLAVAHYNLAQALLASMEPGQALAACDRAIALDPGMADAHLGRGLALAELGRLAESARALEQAKAIDPDSLNRASAVFERDESMPPPAPDPESIYLHRGLRHLSVCQWGRYDTFLADLAKAVGAMLDRGEPIRDSSFAYYMLATEISADLHRRTMENFAAQFEQAAGSRGTVSGRKTPNAGARIRIGYVSPDFREHLNARLTLPIYRLHDRRRFEVYCYSLHADDGSDIRRSIVAAADTFRDASGRQEREIADLIRADEIDILVDLAGMTTHSRPGLFAHCPAPVQASYLGFPGTLGARYIQYRISDRVASPPEQRGYWSEKLAMLPETFYIYDNAEPLAHQELSRAEYGLPEQAMVFCAFHNHYKIDPGIFDLWMRILRRVPGSVLWLTGGSEVAVNNLRREAVARGIEATRLLALPVESRERYRSRFALADLYLDAHLFTAMTTACDALWAGLPLITNPGTAFPSRVASSLLAAMKLDECICPTEQSYENRAVDLAENPAALARLRERVVAARDTTALFDTEGRVRQLERAFETMWLRHLEGLDPEDFDVPR